jgi:hypothetical protein
MIFVSILTHPQFFFLVLCAICRVHISSYIFLFFLEMGIFEKENKSKLHYSNLMNLSRFAIVKEG